MLIFNFLPEGFRCVLCWKERVEEELAGHVQMYLDSIDRS